MDVFDSIRQSSTIAGLIKVAAANNMSLTISFHPNNSDDEDSIDVPCSGDCGGCEDMEEDNK